MAAASTSSAAGAGNQPNTSLYIKNLNTKTKKPELRRQLYALFSTYGKVIDVVATRADGMRGQAFVVFSDLRSATAARRALDGFEFYEKSIKIEYARSRSKATIILEDGPEALFDPSLLSSSGSTSANANAPGKVTYSSAQADQRGREKKRAREEARQRGEKVDDDENEDERDEEEESEGVEEDAEGARETKVRKVDGGANEDGTAAARAQDSDEDDAAMDMADSDSDDDDTPGPPAPPPAS